MPARYRPWSRPAAGVPGTDARYTAAPFSVGLTCRRLARRFDVLVGYVERLFECSRL